MPLESSAEVPRVSVVICTLNGAKRLARCLTAVRNQSLGRNFQLIVVDDGSTDHSVEVAAAFDAEVIRHETNRGVAVARNTGLDAARAPIVAVSMTTARPNPIG